MASFSVTERAVYARCRRQWMYSSARLQSLGPIAPRRSLSLGTTVHAALAQWLLEPDATLYELFLRSSSEQLIKIRDQYRKQVGAEISDDELTGFFEGVELGTSMMKNYEEFWTQPLFNGFRIIEPEQRILVPVPGSDHQLSLRLDGLIERVDDGALFILERKTYSARPKMHDLQYNDQFLSYIWGARQVWDKRIIGVAYDGMWSRAKPPRGSTMPDLFMRLLIERNDYEIEHYAPYCAAQLNEMARLVDAYNNPIAALLGNVEASFYPNRRFQGCFDCQFDPMCALQTAGADYTQYSRSHYAKLDSDKGFADDDE